MTNSDVTKASTNDLIRIVTGTSGHWRPFDTDEAYAELVRRGYRYNPATDAYESTTAD